MGTAEPQVATDAKAAGAQAPVTDGFHLVIDALKLNGIDTIFGLPGIPITDLTRKAQAAGMRVIAVLGTYPPAELEGATVIVKSVTSLNVTSLNGEMQITATPAAPSCG